ncbi:MAG: flagellar motor protein [bacterium]|nr:flagellar motor protein [bacterium]
MDIFAVIGLFFGMGMILTGQAMEGGNLGQLLQITAAFIVLGGTTGAIILSFPAPILKLAISMLKNVFFPPNTDFQGLIKEIGGFATKARKEGIIALEKEAQNASDSLLSLGLGAVADGTDPSLVRSMMENQLEQLEAQVASAAKVYESFGGYSPTLGIIGAVMGLIQVMQNLSDPSKLGAGIAVAFVATIYGLFAANLVMIPLGTRMKFIYQNVFLYKNMIIEGVLSIQAGESPVLIERKLYSFLLDAGPEGNQANG